MDSATEYEKNARDFLCDRDKSPVGDKIVHQWASKLPTGSNVIEIACGGGNPVTQELTKFELNLWAIDSSETLLNKFKKRFPDVRTKCERIQESNFFNKTFDAAIAIGLIFLLPEHEQAELIKCISNILNPDGQFLFTAPIEIGTWRDLTTGIQCRSLGYDKYKEILTNSGFEIVSTVEDEGKNNHYETRKVI
jgi:cyclopropane fatty-acyl-phospholipid synthase-like methyltransferase